MKLNKDGGIEIYIAAKKPKGVPVAEAGNNCQRKPQPALPRLGYQPSKPAVYGGGK